MGVDKPSKSTQRKDGEAEAEEETRAPPRRMEVKHGFTWGPEHGPRARPVFGPLPFELAQERTIFLLSASSPCTGSGRRP